VPYADYVNLLGDKIDALNKNTETLIVANEEVGLEANVDVGVSGQECRSKLGNKNRKQII
jgi:hypothetical protein